jgi:hypothetical protein
VPSILKSLTRREGLNVNMPLSDATRLQAPIRLACRATSKAHI